MWSLTAERSSSQSLPMPDEDLITKQRRDHAGDFLTDIGQRSRRRIMMLDDALGRAWKRSNISDEEYAALRRYRLHWLAGGLSGHLGSVDLNRIYAHDPAAMSGLAKTEKQQDHKRAYYACRVNLGARPVFVSDHVACYDTSLTDTGIMLGYQSRPHAREKAIEILSDAGHRLSKFWKDYDR
jgi:hypothetical protein